MYAPTKVVELKDLPMGCRDIELLWKDKEGLSSMMFVAVSEMRITSRLDSYITNVSV